MGPGGSSGLQTLYRAVILSGVGSIPTYSRHVCPATIFVFGDGKAGHSLGFKDTGYRRPACGVAFWV